MGDNMVDDNCWPNPVLGCAHLSDPSQAMHCSASGRCCRCHICLAAELGGLGGCLRPLSGSAIGLSTAVETTMLCASASLLLTVTVGTGQALAGKCHCSTRSG